MAACAVRKLAWLAPLAMPRKIFELFELAALDRSLQSKEEFLSHAGIAQLVEYLICDQIFSYLLLNVLMRNIECDDVCPSTLAMRVLNRRRTTDEYAILPKCAFATSK